MKFILRGGECKHLTKKLKKIKPERTPPSLLISELVATQFSLMISKLAVSKFSLMIFE